MIYVIPLTAPTGHISVLINASFELAVLSAYCPHNTNSNWDWAWDTITSVCKCDLAHTRQRTRIGAQAQNATAGGAAQAARLAAENGLGRSSSPGRPPGAAPELAVVTWHMADRKRELSTGMSQGGFIGPQEGDKPVPLLGGLGREMARAGHAAPWDTHTTQTSRMG